jgi:HSP20 family molecular chaperone IbpA
VVKVHFPGSKMKDLDLDVTKNRIKAESSTLRLFTYLPRSVDHENGSAKFDAKRELLIVTLPIMED